MAGDTAATTVRAYGSMKVGVFLRSGPQAEQKVEPKEHVSHVPVQDWPGAVLVLIHAVLVLLNPEPLLDRPAQGPLVANLSGPDDCPDDLTIRDLWLSIIPPVLSM